MALSDADILVVGGGGAGGSQGTAETGGGGGSGGGRRTPATPKKTKTEVDMSPEEVDVIAQAIEGITEL